MITWRVRLLKNPGHVLAYLRASRQVFEQACTDKDNQRELVLEAYRLFRESRSLYNSSLTTMPIFSREWFRFQRQALQETRSKSKAGGSSQRHVEGGLVFRSAPL